MNVHMYTDTNLSFPTIDTNLFWKAKIYQILYTYRLYMVPFAVERNVNNVNMQY